MRPETEQIARPANTAVTYESDAKESIIAEMAISILGTMVVLWLQLVFRATLVGGYLNY